MTRHEANAIAVLRIHFGCTHSKLGGLARAIWGVEHCQQMANSDAVAPSILGRDLISEMERCLSFEMCETDNLELSELVCLKCHGTTWSIHTKADTAKECEHCGEMAAINPSNEA